MKSPMMRTFWSVIWILTALGCIHLGLVALGHDPVMMLGLGSMARGIQLLLGAAGVVSLALFFMHGSCNSESSCSGR